MPRAILSVHDKTGLNDLAAQLAGMGWSLIASGGTARQIKSLGIPVTEVADYTGSPEILGGRVKTLHPAIHGGLLSRGTAEDHTELQNLGWDEIDLVAVNLYPFEETIAREGVTLAEAIENIDIGGVTLIRAAAKNLARVTLLCDPRDYNTVTSELRSQGSVCEETRRRLAVKGFQQTARYDALIASYLGDHQVATLNLFEVQKLRYGENPHQAASLYAYEACMGPLGGKVLQGKELSYNNLLDLDAAWRAAICHAEPAVAIVKHLSPCGIAAAENLTEAYKLALASDPVSAYGGIVAANREFDQATAEALREIFLECVVAPGFSEGALEVLGKRKNLRLLSMPDLEIEPRKEYRSITRGMLVQDVDFGDPEAAEWKVMSRRKPSEAEMTALRFAWKACQHVKSNSIVLARGTATVGIGGGQPNRVDCVRMAIQRAGERVQGAVMASDAFFPFPDSIELAAAAGVSAVIHPGGSIRDEESLAAANEAGMAVVYSGVRHFRH